MNIGAFDRSIIFDSLVISDFYITFCFYRNLLLYKNSNQVIPCSVFICFLCALCHNSVAHLLQ